MKPTVLITTPHHLSAQIGSPESDKFLFCFVLGEGVKGSGLSFWFGCSFYEWRAMEEWSLVLALSAVQGLPKNGHMLASLGNNTKQLCPEKIVFSWFFEWSRFFLRPGVYKTTNVKRRMEKKGCFRARWSQCQRKIETEAVSDGVAGQAGGNNIIISGRAETRNEKKTPWHPQSNRSLCLRFPVEKEKVTKGSLAMQSPS